MAAAEPLQEAGRFDGDRRRTVVLLCPDWPVSAAAHEAELPASRPAAIFTGNIVTACSAPARRVGVAVGQRRRQAQQRCPELAILRPDPGRDARLFESVVHSVGEVAAAALSVHPGVLTVPASAARYFGSAPTAERILAERIVTAVADETGYESLLGIADGLFAGLIAAARSARVMPGGTPAYLADLDVGQLNRPEVPEFSGRHELISLLRRLGLTTFGAFAALEPAAVAGRFGADAARAHRQARGLPDTPMGAVRPDVELAVETVLDPPADRVDMAAFAARPLAERFLSLIAGRSLTCTQVRIEAHTDAGDVSVRMWRAGASFTAADIAERTRWQLDGWLSGASTGSAPNGPITGLRLEADEVTSPAALQPTVWDDKREDDERVRRTISRLQGLLGMDTVLAGTLVGGPDATGDTRWTPWQQAAPVPRPGPWPGRLPSPHP
ncbi:DNA polymerase Y family protein, partial [Spelaeicoccus albus]